MRARRAGCETAVAIKKIFPVLQVDGEMPDFNSTRVLSIMLPTMSCLPAC